MYKGRPDHREEQPQTNPIVPRVLVNTDLVSYLALYKQKQKCSQQPVPVSLGNSHLIK